MESRIDFAGELMEEKSPNATPVFRTYVMLNNPSITEIDSFRSSWDWMRILVQRSKASIEMTSNRYGKRAPSLDGIKAKVYHLKLKDLFGGESELWYSHRAFSTEVETKRDHET